MNIKYVNPYIFQLLVVICQTFINNINLFIYMIVKLISMMIIFENYNT